MIPINVIKTPDKVCLTRIQIDQILRDHIEQLTGRKVMNNCIVTNSNSGNPVTGEYKMTFELIDAQATGNSDKVLVDGLSYKVQKGTKV